MANSTDQLEILLHRKHCQEANFGRCGDKEVQVRSYPAA